MSICFSINRDWNQFWLKTGNDIVRNNSILFIKPIFIVIENTLMIQCKTIKMDYITITYRYYTYKELKCFRYKVS